jgi:hypothetical protein
MPPSWPARPDNARKIGIRPMQDAAKAVPFLRKSMAENRYNLLKNKRI